MRSFLKKLVHGKFNKQKSNLMYETFKTGCDQGCSKMKMKGIENTIVAVLTICLLAVVPMSGCIGEKEEAAPEQIGLVLGIGGLNDLSFNDNSYRGAKDAERDFDVKVRYVEPMSIADFETHLISFAQFIQ